MIVTHQKSKFKVYTGEKLYGEIVFDDNSLEASLMVRDKVFRVEKGHDKNMELKYQNQVLFRFEFDYIWGGAEITSNGIDTGYDIKGRWFKPGTRLTDHNDKDLIIAVKKNDGLEVTILDESISEEMILATVYYHIYSSAGKMLSVMMISSI